MRISYNPPWWLIVVEAIVSISILVSGAITLNTEPCGTSQISFLLNVWLIVAGCIGLFYSMSVFIFMFLFCACACCMLCLVPILMLVILAKFLFYIIWAIIGIVFLSTNPTLHSTCPVAFGFAIATVVLLLIDTIPTWKYTKVNEKE